MHILLVEPDTILARTYAHALERSGHTVRCVRGAQAAVQEVDETVPDLIILEPQLARHNGVELLYELRSYTEWQHVPVIILTQLAPDVFAGNPQLSDHLGVLYILAKSHTSLNNLVETVNKLAVDGAL